MTLVAKYPNLTGASSRDVGCEKTEKFAEQPETREKVGPPTANPTHAGTFAARLHRQAALICKRSFETLQKGCNADLALFRRIRSHPQQTAHHDVALPQVGSQAAALVR
ncbi:MAG: hypothetical protein BM558_00575 [Roseobacter sp. MedPE-SW]|nr:MAG: hypothetical protein BM558_00575 [Roseobacter sp. MedPE-SW]